MKQSEGMGTERGLENVASDALAANALLVVFWTDRTFSVSACDKRQQLLEWESVGNCGESGGGICSPPEQEQEENRTHTIT